MRTGLITASVLPLLILMCGWIFNWPIFPNPAISKADTWTIAGTALSYFGVLFSAYAAYEVGTLSRKYFAKTRFPEIRSKLTSITTDMAKVANKRAVDLRAERFPSQIPVALGEIERIQGHKLSKKTDTTTTQYKLFIEWINHPLNRDRVGNDSTVYWDLFRALNEISDEITAFLREQESK